MRSQMTMSLIVLTLISCGQALGGERWELPPTLLAAASIRQAAGTRTAAVCCTGGIRIVFRVKRPRTTTAASRFPGCAGRPTRRTTSGGRRRSSIPRAMVSEISTSRIELNESTQEGK